MNDEHMQMIEDCEARRRRINEWEAGFLASIRVRLEKETLTTKQIDILNSIWERATARG